MSRRSADTTLSEFSQLQGAEGISLAQVAQAVRRRWRWVTAVTLLGFGAMTAYVQVATPRYTAEAKILLESRETFYTRPSQDRGEPVQLIDEQAVASQVQVVTSRDLAREAIRRLSLVGNKEFDPLADGIGPVRQILVMLGLAKDPLDRDPEERILDTYLDHLLVYSAGKSRILTIEFRSRDAGLAARAANVAAEVYLEAQEAAKNDTARSASNWLGTNVAALRTRVAEAEGRVEEFRTRTGLFAGGSNGGPIGSQQLAELSTQLSQARSAQAESQAKARLIKELIQSGRTFEIPDVANNELIRRLIEQRVNLRTQLALEQRTLLLQHPRIKELNAQLNDLESQIRGAAERTVRTLENDAKIAGSRVDSLRAAVEGQKTVVGQANESEVQLRALEREARVQRDQLESYMSRYREAAARDGGSAAPADARVVSRAVVPDLPSFPKKLPMIAFATLAAFVLASGWIVLRELMGTPRLALVETNTLGEAREERVSEPAPVSTGRALVPYIGGVGSTDLRAEPVRYARDTDVLESRYDFESLVARLQPQGHQARGRRVVVTGYGAPHGGADDLALALGRYLARRARTLFIALDRSGREVDDLAGFTDFVGGAVSFGDIIGREHDSRLHRIVAGLAPQGRLMLEPDAVELALSAFDETYAWVLCLLHDPMNADGAMLSLFSRLADTVIIVSEEDPADPALVAIYETATEAGAHDVIVAREQALTAEVETA